MDFSDGKLELVLGTMFSGKTTYLLNKISIFSELNFKILYANIEFDNRSELKFSTHNLFLNSNESKKNLQMIKTKKLSEIDFSNYDIILIDEAHFFEDLVDVVKDLLNKKKYVIVSFLMGDYKGDLFGHAVNLIPLCDEIHRLQAFCTICAKEKKHRIAIYSKRIFDSEETIDIGGIEKYIPVCRTHYKD